MIRVDGRAPRPFRTEDAQIDRSWTAGGRDWLWKGHKREESYKDIFENW